MKVYECTANEERCIIGVDRKYLKIATAKETIGIEEIDSIQIENNALIVLLYDKNTLKIRGLQDEDLKSIQETVKSRRMISKEEITDGIKKNIQLQKTYKNLNQSEYKIFYKLFGDLLLKNVKEENALNIEQTSKTGRARFIFSNRILLSVYFRLDMSFGLFMTYFYSGYLTGEAENEVDVEVFKALKRPISPIERINVRSLLLLDDTAEKEKIKIKEIPKKKEHLINPDLVKILSENFLDQRTDKKHKKIEHKKLFVPKLKITTIEPLKRVGVPGEILRRMKEVSKLIYKNKTASEDLIEISEDLQKSLKEEIRRKLPIEQGNAVLSAINRIIPGRFLKKITEK